MRAAIQSRQGKAASGKAVHVFEEPIAELSATAVHPTTRPAVVWAPLRAAKDMWDTPLVVVVSAMPHRVMYAAMHPDRLVHPPQPSPTPVPPLPPPGPMPDPVPPSPPSPVPDPEPPGPSPVPVPEPEPPHPEPAPA